MTKLNAHTKEEIWSAPKAPSNEQAAGFELNKSVSDEKFVPKLGFNHKDIQLIFPIQNFFMLGSPLAMFVSCYF